MGSDDGAKVHASCGTRRCRTFLRRCGRRRSSLLLPSSNKNIMNNNSTQSLKPLKTVSVVLGLILLTWTALWLFLPPPERLFFPSFPANISALPPQCHAKAQHFYHCQQQTDKRWVIGCHRQWCAANYLGGHCEQASGIGDRMRYLNSLLQDADTHCVRIELDYPMLGMELLDTAQYTDPGGWWNYLLRRRSYDVSDHATPDQQYWDKHSQSSTTQQQQQHPPSIVQYTHIQPLKNFQYHIRTFDPCYFHFVMRPHVRVQSQLQREIYAMMTVGRKTSSSSSSSSSKPTFTSNPNDKRLVPGKGSVQSPSDIDVSYGHLADTLRHHRNNDTDLIIGLHFRTGDSAAFAERQWYDNRLPPNATLRHATYKLLDCADALADRLDPEPAFARIAHIPLSPIVIPRQHTYVLMTDNPQVKQLIQKDAVEVLETPSGTSSISILKDGRRIYMTNVKAQMLRGGLEGDRDSWMEIFLLSQLDGLVLNVVPSSYNGSALSRSLFAETARLIGFMDTYRELMPCPLE